MDNKRKKNVDDLVKKKLNKTTTKIIKSRKNFEVAQKEAAEFDEIHKLLESSETETISENDSQSSLYSADVKHLESSVIPLTSPGERVFNENLCFSLFNNKSLCLKDFINNQEKCVIFGKDKSIPSEECFRKLILHHVAEALLPEKRSYPSIGLYVLYLMSVGEESAFVHACYNFLILYPFHLHVVDIIPIFLNFGIDQKYCNLNQTLFAHKFSYSNDNYKSTGNQKFPNFNMEMVGKILLYYITNNFINISIEIKYFVKVLAKITLDSKVRSNSLLALYSTILTTICCKIKESFNLKEIVSWLFFDEDHLLNQLEICRTIAKTVFPKLHDTLVLTTIYAILKCRNMQPELPIKIDLIKFVLKKLKTKKLHLLELYSVLQLINNSLPGITTTIEDSLEINLILVSIEKKIQAKDTVDLIRLKLELAKVRNLVANNINNCFTVNENLKTS